MNSTVLAMIGVGISITFTMLGLYDFSNQQFGWVLADATLATLGLMIVFAGTSEV